MKIITIEKSDSTTGWLDLGEGGNLGAAPNEKISWHLKNGCGVESITYMSVKPSPPADPSVDIWSDPPHQDGNSSNWTATIKRTAALRDEWNYNIHWKATDGKTPPPFDPKIIVNTTVAWPS